MKLCLTVNDREMSHDPEVYADPFKFNPDRFLGDTPELNPKELFFGFGRRYIPALDCICSVLTDHEMLGFVQVNISPM